MTLEVRSRRFTHIQCVLYVHIYLCTLLSSKLRLQSQNSSSAPRTFSPSLSINLTVGELVLIYDRVGPAKERRFRIRRVRVVAVTSTSVKRRRRRAAKINGKYLLTLIVADSFNSIGTDANISCPPQKGTKGRSGGSGGGGGGRRKDESLQIGTF